MSTKNLMAIAVVCGLSALARPAAAADTAALAKEVADANVSLTQGLKAAESEGRPISAKYEIEDGALQLSVYTAKGSAFREVIVDHKTGAIKRTETITDADDIKHANAQLKALMQAKTPLSGAVDTAVGANSSSRAVSVTPVLQSGHPVARITLLSGGATKDVTEKLD